MSLTRSTTAPTALHRLLLSVALLAFMSRALVPAGFMPGHAHGSVQMVFCHGGLHHAPAGTPRSRTASDGICAFAASAGPALHGTWPAAAAAVDPPTLLVASTTVVSLATVPLRHSAPRGPPIPT